MQIYVINNNNNVGVNRTAVAVGTRFTSLALAIKNWRISIVLGTNDRKKVREGKEHHGQFYRVLNRPDDE